MILNNFLLVFNPSVVSQYWAVYFIWKTKTFSDESYQFSDEHMIIHSLIENKDLSVLVESFCRSHTTQYRKKFLIKLS